MRKGVYAGVLWVRMCVQGGTDLATTWWLHFFTCTWAGNHPGNVSAPRIDKNMVCRKPVLSVWCHSSSP